MIQVHRFAHPIRLMNLGDIHKGNKNCDVKTLRKNIALIASDPQMYWVSTGDILETATKNSKSSCYDADDPETELDDMAAELAPIRLKCLGFVASNHHNRISKEVGLSLDKVLADRARIPFLGISATIKIVCGRASYFVFMHHGCGGGTDGNKVNRALKLAQNLIGADVYLTGHTHSFSHVPDIHKIIDRKRDKLTQITTHHVTTGHYLRYEGSYAEDMGLKEKPIGSALITFEHNDTGNEYHKDIKVELAH